MEVGLYSGSAVTRNKIKIYEVNHIGPIKGHEALSFILCYIGK